MANSVRCSSGSKTSERLAPARCQAALGREWACFRPNPLGKTDGRDRGDFLMELAQPSEIDARSSAVRSLDGTEGTGDPASGRVPTRYYTGHEFLASFQRPQIICGIPMPAGSVRGQGNSRAAGLARGAHPNSHDAGAGRLVRPSGIAMLAASGGKRHHGSKRFHQSSLMGPPRYSTPIFLSLSLTAESAPPSAFNVPGPISLRYSRINSSLPSPRAMFGK